MPAPQEPRRSGGPDADAPEEFRRAVRQMQSAPLRTEVHLEQMPAPQRIAPYAHALTADVTVDGEEVGTGRLVLLHDPQGADAWGGTFRCVAYARADIEPETAADPMLAGVGWSWLTEALDAYEADYLGASGTVTCVSSESFGGLDGEGANAQIEVRASWTPGEDLTPHVEAWAQLLCQAVGLPPVPEGVTSLPGRRGGHRAVRAHQGS